MLCLSEHLRNMKLSWVFFFFVFKRKRRDRKCYYSRFSQHWVSLLSFITLPHDGNYIHSIFFSQTLVTRCYQCFISNSKSADQKLEKSPPWEFNTFFHTKYGTLIPRVKGYFYAWMEPQRWCKDSSQWCLLPQGTKLSMWTCSEV